MQVTSISVNVRYSKRMGDGSFKTLELGCEGALDSEEDWQEVQADLYHQLGDQMRYVFSNSGRAQNGPEKAIQLPPAPLLREHWCQVHQAEYRQFTKERRRRGTPIKHRMGSGARSPDLGSIMALQGEG